jgi:hypothetical protein
MAKTKKGGAAAGAVASAPTGSEAAYMQYLGAAKALAAAEVKPMRSDPTLAAYNVRQGLKALEPYGARLKKELPKLDHKAIAKAGDISLAVVYAAGLVYRDVEATKGMADLVRRGWELRDLLLVVAEATSKAGLVPAASVKKIRQGWGYFDMADDLVRLSALLRKHWPELKGKCPLTVATLDEAAKVGTELLETLTPGSAARSRKMPTAVREVADVRDRLWTLLVRAHSEMRRAGMWLWVEDVDAYVPPLQARAGKSRKERKAEEPAPAAGE